MRYILGIDLGTSYFKAAVFSSSGKILGLGRQAVTKDQDRSGKCELPIERFWRILAASIAEATVEAEIYPDQIEAVGYSSQANSYLLLDKECNPLTPLILWPDTRPGGVYPESKQLWQAPDFLQTTGVGIDINPSLMANKLLWHQKEQPEIWEKTRYIKTISDHLIFSLTGNHYSDLGTASLLGLLDVKREIWWPKALEIIGINKSMLSDNIRSGQKAGTITSDGSKLLGLKEDIPVYAGSLDHYMAAIGAGIGQATNVTESTGTVVACVNIANKFKPQRGVCISNSIWKGKYFQLAFSENGAVSLEWYKNLFAPRQSMEQLVKMAQQTGTSAGLVAQPMAYKYHGLEAFEGICDKHTHGHFINATMESVAITLKDLILKLNHEIPATVISTGGGAQSSHWLNIKSDILDGCSFIAADCREPACKGAAMICCNKTPQNTKKI